MSHEHAKEPEITAVLRNATAELRAMSHRLEKLSSHRWRFIDEQVEQLEAHADQLTALAKAVNDQAEDEGLWFMAHYASEAYLQQALRKLHLLVEALLGRA